jgi:hypothetical protein
MTESRVSVTKSAASRTIIDRQMRGRVDDVVTR